MDYFDFRNVSIHAPTKGATLRNCLCVRNWTVSIHAPTKGATMAYVYSNIENVSFNPRSHEGSDKKGRLNMSEQYVSIHAPTKGATHSGRTGFNGKCVSIHAPTKGATAISAKNSFQFSAEINKLSFYILNFPLFPSPLFSTFHFICAYFRVRIPRHFYVCFLFALLYYHKIYHLLQFYNRHIFLFYL